ncbi:cell division protein FtsQ/DivIB [Corynebacterium ulceribovis]|uniref:cell division protein FtsQ/DivIB n=1 Tax=Corynebacterium ulceribovis TaxID=487732 RepID=UPI00037042DA|nr:FtsQ-type POTRA domain-containing protein [Corynebacterium ulceribovis]
MKKRNITIAAGIALLLAIIAAAVLYFVPVLKVKTIAVDGMGYTQQAEVDAVLADLNDTNLLRVDTAAAANRLVELPWVARAAVDRELPSTVAVTLEEHQPRMFYRNKGESYLVNEEGEVFLVGPPPKGTAELAAKDPKPETVKAALDVINALNDPLRKLVKKVEAKGPREIVLQLNDGRSVNFGSTDNLHDKVLAMETVLKREGKHWDVSNPYLPAVK